MVEIEKFASLANLIGMQNPRIETWFESYYCIELFIFRLGYKLIMWYKKIILFSHFAKCGKIYYLAWKATVSFADICNKSFSEDLWIISMLIFCEDSLFLLIWKKFHSFRSKFKRFLKQFKLTYQKIP